MLFYDTAWVVIMEELSPCFGINPYFDSGSPNMFLLVKYESKKAFLDTFASQKGFSQPVSNLLLQEYPNPSPENTKPTTFTTIYCQHLIKNMSVWQFSTTRLVKVSNDQGVYLRLVPVATDGIVIFDRICWGTDMNPKLDIEYNRNGSGIARKI